MQCVVVPSLSFRCRGTRRMCVAIRCSELQCVLQCPSDAQGLQECVRF